MDVDYFQGLFLDQAKRQFEAANRLPVRWVVAENRFADYLRKLFDENNLAGIEIVHIPAKP